MCIIERCRNKEGYVPMVYTWLSSYWKHRNGEWGCCGQVTLEAAALYLTQPKSVVAVLFCCYNCSLVFGCFIEMRHC